MNIWKILYDQDYENFNSISDDSFLFFDRNFRGDKILNYNKIIDIETGFKGEKAENGEKVDISNLGTIPIFMPNAIRILEPSIKHNIQKIKLNHKEYGECYAINVLTVLDCLNEEKCIMQRLRSGKVFKISKYEFNKEINYPDIFKITTDNKTGIFVTENFIRKVTENKLKGILFKKVWESEQI